MCSIEKVKKCSFLYKPYVIVIIQIILETWMLSMQLYASHETLIGGLILIDEIFGGISALFLVLSVGALFVFSCETFYTHYKIIGGIQGVIMIVNGIIFIISVVALENSTECAKIEEFKEGDLECQPFEIRVFVGCLAIFDGILYFLRRPIGYRFNLRNGELGRFSEAFGNSSTNDKILFKNSQQFIMSVHEPKEAEEYSDYILKVDCPMSKELTELTDCTDSGTTGFRTPASSRAVNESKVPGSGTKFVPLGIAMTDLGSAFSSIPKTTFSYMGQEYFLPNHPSTITNKGTKGAFQNNNDDSGYSRRNTELQSSNAFA